MTDTCGQAHLGRSTDAFLGRAGGTGRLGGPSSATASLPASVRMCFLGRPSSFSEAALSSLGCFTGRGGDGSLVAGRPPDAPRVPGTGRLRSMGATCAPSNFMIFTDFLRSFCAIKSLGRYQQQQDAGAGGEKLQTLRPWQIRTRHVHYSR